MSAAQVLSPVTHLQETKDRQMTYQVALCGRDGVVLASDRCELSRGEFGGVAVVNRLNKIRVAGGYAWAYSGGELSHVLAQFVAQGFKAHVGKVTDTDALQIVISSQGPAFQQWQASASGACGKSEIILVCGASKRIFRCDSMPKMEPEEIFGGQSIAGQLTSAASFLSRRFASPEASVDMLASLAAYAVRSAHDFDSGIIDGLDLVIFRYSDLAKGFTFLDSDLYWEHAARLNNGIRNLLQANASPVTAS